MKLVLLKFDKMDKLYLKLKEPKLVLPSKQSKLAPNPLLDKLYLELNETEIVLPSKQSKLAPNSLLFEHEWA